MSSVIKSVNQSWSLLILDFRHKTIRIPEVVSILATKKRKHKTKIGISSKLQAQAKLEWLEDFPSFSLKAFRHSGTLSRACPGQGKSWILWKYIWTIFENTFQSLESISTMQVDPSNLKSLSFNRRGIQPQTFTCFSGPRRPLQCLVSKFLNFYKLSRPMIWWSRPIPHVEAFGPSGCSHVDDKVAMVDHTSGCHQKLLVVIWFIAIDFWWTYFYLQ